MSTRSKLWPLASACVASMALLTGCADYLNHRDSVTLAAGNAQEWNRVVHALDPWPPYVENADIEGDGRRIADVMARSSAANAGQEPTGEPTQVGGDVAEAN